MSVGRVAVLAAAVAAAVAAAPGPTIAADPPGGTDPSRTPGAAGAPPPGDARWATTFLLHCSGCHGTDGRGVGSVPDLRGNLGHLLSIPDGRRFVLQVPGVANARLSDADLAQLTNWMARTFAPATTPKDFRPFDADEVRAARRSVPADVAGERRRVVAALRERGIDAR